MPDTISMIADGLVAMSADGMPSLIGGRDRETGRIRFPAPVDTAAFDPVTLPDRGRLWSWTVQRFRPKSPPYAGPAAFEPYAVGYIELPDAVIVEARLVDVAFDALVIGMAMRLVTEHFELEDGSTRLTFAFTPDREHAA